MAASILKLCGVLSLGALFCALALRSATQPPQGDIAWPLYLAAEVLDGARLGRDYIEVNPPLFVWLAIPAVVLARETGITAWGAYIVLGSVLVLVSVGLTVASLRLAGYGGRSFVAVGLGALFAMTVLPQWESYQREHLMVICVMPYLALASARVRGARPHPLAAVAIGVIGACGFALKPHYLLAWGLVEGYLGRRLGLSSVRRIEVVVVTAAGLLYLLTVAWIAPEYLRSLRMIASTYQLYLGEPWYFNVAPTWWMLLPSVAIVGLGLRWKHSNFPLEPIVLLMIVGVWLGAVLQGKGLQYHYLPAVSFGFLGLALLGASVFTEGFSRATAWSAAAGVITVSALISGRILSEVLRGASASYLSDDFFRLRDTLLPEARGKTIAVLSSNLASGWPLTPELGSRWGLRYVSLWPLAGFYANQLRSRPGIVEPRPLADRTGFELQFSKGVVSDLERAQPHLLLVLLPKPGVLSGGGALRFDYLAYFDEEPRFRTLLRDYDDMGTVSGYRVLRRNRAPATVHGLGY